MYYGSARLSTAISAKVMLQAALKLSRHWTQISSDLKNPKKHSIMGPHSIALLSVRDSVSHDALIAHSISGLMGRRIRAGSDWLDACVILINAF